ncbi:MAG TPA: amidase [Gemmatimonadaceae bacterium]|nr:amidase [Gemmatimonadaceae bacterium]
MPLTDRRAFMAYCGSLGLGSTLFPGVLWARLAEGAEITTETIVAAAELAGVSFEPAEREMMVESLKRQVRQIEALHEVPLPNAVSPAIVFNPLPAGMTLEGEQRPIRRAPVHAPAVPGNLEELAFRPVTELSELVRTRKVTSMQLTRMYLDRLKRYDPQLHCVVTLTEERALAQARAADEEIAGGRYRGPLHGIPWGAKDLLAVKGYPTTWGAAPYRTQTFDEDATVVQRLDEAGAVLIAKLTLGALAMGDVWFGGRTRNPWNPEQGSSGSSAGPGSATAAGLVGFSIGTETLGSISSPSTRNGVTGLRPTFGRVPRTGAMALSWTMDKIGPMTRSAEDAALVLAAIQGPDGRDLSVHRAPFNWDATLDLRQLRVGYVQSAFESTNRNYTTKAFDQAVLDVLRGLGITLTPVELPDAPYGPMRLILNAEAAAAFDELTRSGRDAELTEQGPGAWPNTFRTARFIPAVDYVNANRVRSQTIAQWAELMKTVDVIVTPTNGGNQLTATNLTGHPAVIVPNGFRENGTPVSITFLGGLFEEAKPLAVAHAYQQATDFHRRTPSLTTP